MTFKLPDLPYAYDALAPHMSRETLEFHHDKHHLAYVNTGNGLIENNDFSGLSLTKIVKKAYADGNQALINQAGQHYNHLHFWNWMKPNGGGTALPGKVEGLVAAYGGLDKVRADFIQAGTTQFGSGWAWLAVKDGKLEVTKTPNGEKPADARLPAHPRLRRLGTQLLHRLPQRAPEIPRGLLRQPGQLGLRRRHGRRGVLEHVQYRSKHIKVANAARRFAARPRRPERSEEQP